MKGLFIVIEGPDGCGKSTITKQVTEKMKQKGIEYIKTREPGGVDIAEQIRDVILNPENIKMDVKTEALLYAASRRQHLVEKILPAINDGVHVICERFVESSLAYQGYGRDIGIKEVYQINEFAIDGVLPDLTIFLDISPETGLQRINRNRKSLDRLDLETLDFHQKVYEGYMKVKEMYKNRIQVVNANQSIETIVEEVYSIIENKIREN